jgi:hypothetical protein
VPLNALFRLAFATASGVTPLTLRHRITRRIILRKARRQACRPRRFDIALRLFVSMRFQVLFHSARGRTFHLSLMVLVHYRSPRVFSLGRWTSRLPTGLACPVVLKDSAEVWLSFTYRTITLCGRPFQCRSARDQIGNFHMRALQPRSSRNPIGLG